jgi:hypothetical protein
MVAVLIWRVIQIVQPEWFNWLPWVNTGPDGPEVPEVIPIEIKDPEPFKPSQVDMTRFATVTANRWEVPGERRDNTPEREDPGLPDIQLAAIEDVGGNPWARIRVDGGTAQLVRVKSLFAERRARLDRIDTENKKILFTWLPTDKQYERTLTG